MFNFFKPKIKVSFIDYDTGNQFGVSEMLPSQLPSSFEAATTLNIQGQNWEVVEATPVTSKEFIKTRNLKLTLRKISIENINPKDLLYSLPTISNDLPKIKDGSSKIGKKVFEMREDDWRQYDFIPIAKKNVVFENINAIQNIFQNHSKKLDENMLAFTELFVRRGIDQPFSDCNISRDSIIDMFDIVEEFEGISFSGVAGIVDDGFALKISDNEILYGIEKNGAIVILSMFVIDWRKSSLDKFDKLYAALEKHKLCLVDWCGCNIYSSEAENVLSN